MKNKACACQVFESGKVRHDLKECHAFKELSQWILEKKQYLLKQKSADKSEALAGEDGLTKKEDCLRQISKDVVNSFNYKDDLDMKKGCLREIRLDFWSINEYVLCNRKCLDCRRCVYRILHENPMVYKMLNNNWFRDIRFMRWLCSNHGNALVVAHPNVRNDYRAVLNATKKDALSLGFAAQRFKENPKFIILAGNGNPSALMYASGKVLSDMLEKYCVHKKQTDCMSAMDLSQVKYPGGVKIGVKIGAKSPATIFNNVVWKDKEFIVKYLQELEAMEEQRELEQVLRKKESELFDGRGGGDEKSRRL